ncbi:167_t:CDS:2 [Paraglomus brasilianum]|uniref:167_t:CDS:1 n=1 Tax=Paraglomus brasilianum TaxID=144538 RepID=A0A9N8ZRH3_9GLOM|nr:167_t:CDS:2 [Paraglomus brasilianum]
MSVSVCAHSVVVAVITVLITVWLWKRTRCPLRTILNDIIQPICNVVAGLHELFTPFERNIRIQLEIFGNHLMELIPTLAEWLSAKRIRRKMAISNIIN